jgi:serine protease AprX
MIQIPSPLVEFILLGPSDDRRQLQDSPILGDVWVDFGREPANRRDLLIAPYRGQHAGEVAAIIDQEVAAIIEQELDSDDADKDKDLANVAFLQGLIAARLKFKEVLVVVVPKTRWWAGKVIGDARATDDKDGAPGLAAALANKMVRYIEQKLKSVLTEILDAARAWNSNKDREKDRETDKEWEDELSSFDRFLALSAFLLWADSAPDANNKTKSPTEQVDDFLKLAEAELDVMIPLLLNQIKKMLEDTTWQKMLEDEKFRPLVWEVSRNRGAMPAITLSVPAVKADAATTLFKVNCSKIGWAVIDSGIDGLHPAFFDKDGNSRVKRSFDFKNFRKIVSLSNSKEKIRKKNLADLMADRELLFNPLPDDEAEKALERLAVDASKRGPVHWELVERFVEIKPDSRPRTNHGTHVAGIIGASRKAAVDAAVKAAVRAAGKDAREAALEQAAREAEAKAAVSADASAEEKAAEKAAEKAVDEAIAKAEEKAKEKAKLKGYPDFADGMCPDINLYDFRVLGGPELKDTEFAIIAALQFIRHLNDRDILLTIHGANMSLSIPHDVRNFACGRTPICDEAERLVSSGVVVVAAAGNHGYKSFQTKEGAYDSYAAFSITDPGNADSVLTVGATHRFWPHTYGISFFSSRGPTGDGRIKPDLVAPGERIRAPLPGKYSAGGQWGDLDGTSMAAPHVSGAAAMLMARYSELVGQPRRIKRILCESATDLGRERSFQGHGMLDVLRAFQSI